MMPPFPNNGRDRWVVNLEAPLGQWQIFDTFDSGDVCSQERILLGDALEKKYDLHGGDLGAFLSRYSGVSLQHATDEQRLMAQCISTDGPRLKGK